MVDRINIFVQGNKRSTTVKVPLNRWDMLCVCAHVCVFKPSPKKNPPSAPLLPPWGAVHCCSQLSRAFLLWVGGETSLSFSFGEGEDRMEGSMLLAEALLEPFIYALFLWFHPPHLTLPLPQPPSASFQTGFKAGLWAACALATDEKACTAARTSTPVFMTL